MSSDDNKPNDVRFDPSAHIRGRPSTVVVIDEFAGFAADDKPITPGVKFDHALVGAFDLPHLPPRRWPRPVVGFVRVDPGSSIAVASAPLIEQGIEHIAWATPDEMNAEPEPFLMHCQGAASLLADRRGTIVIPSLAHAGDPHELYAGLLALRSARWEFASLAEGIDTTDPGIKGEGISCLIRDLTRAVGDITATWTEKGLPAPTVPRWFGKITGDNAADQMNEMVSRCRVVVSNNPRPGEIQLATPPWVDSAE